MSVYRHEEKISADERRELVLSVSDRYGALQDFKNLLNRFPVVIQMSDCIRYAQLALEYTRELHPLSGLLMRYPELVDWVFFAESNQPSVTDCGIRKQLVAWHEHGLTYRDRARLVILVLARYFGVQDIVVELEADPALSRISTQVRMQENGDACVGPCAEGSCVPRWDTGTHLQVPLRVHVHRRRTPPPSPPCQAPAPPNSPSPEDLGYEVLLDSDREDTFHMLTQEEVETVREEARQAAAAQRAACAEQIPQSPVPEHKQY